MGTLEKVMQMRNQGLTDSQIINSLRQEGRSPKEINEALSQSQIKGALNSEQNDYASTSEIPPQATPESQMQPSMMQNQEYSQGQQPSSQMQEIPSSFQQYTMPAQETYFQNPDEYSYPEDQYNYPEYSEQYPEYQPGGSIETMNEIAEQIVDEKISQIKKETSSFTKFREEIILDVEKLNERLSKIENTLDELQAAILRKVGDYGQNIQEIAKEMHDTQNSFSKILNPLTDNIRELREITKSQKNEKSKSMVNQTPMQKPIQPKKNLQPKTSSTNDFEDYLR